MLRFWGRGFDLSLQMAMFVEYCARVSQLQKQCVAHHKLRIFLLLPCCFEKILLLSTGCHIFFTLCFLRIGSKVQLFFLFKLTLFFGRSHFQLLKLGWRLVASDPSFSLQPIARVAPDTWYLHHFLGCRGVPAPFSGLQGGTCTIFWAAWGYLHQFPPP